MVNTVLLNNDKHRDVRVDPGFCRDYGDAVMWSQTFFPEFRAVQAHYPILFQKEPGTGRFFSVALFGFEQGENLFLTKDGRWDAGYIPLMMQRIPFSIGVYNGDSDEARRRMVHIDLDHPKVRSDKGLRLFEEHGANTDYLDRVSGMLEAIHHWNEYEKAFIDVVTELKLLEQVTMDITLKTGTKGQLLGFYAIHEERLKELTGEQLAALNEQGFLEPIFMVVASTQKIRTLMDRKAQREAS